MCTQLILQFCSLGKHAKLIQFHMKPKRAHIVLGIENTQACIFIFLFLLNISQSQQRKTARCIHSSHQLCSICLSELICFPLLLNNRWIEQNNEFGIFRIIKRVTWFSLWVLWFGYGHNAVLWLGEGFFFFSALKWIHPNSTILLFFPSPFAEMMVLQREGPEWLKVMQNEF